MVIVFLFVSVVMMIMNLFVLMVSIMIVVVGVRSQERYGEDKKKAKKKGRDVRKDTLSATKFVERVRDKVLKNNHQKRTGGNP